LVCHVNHWSSCKCSLNFLPMLLRRPWRGVLYAVEALPTSCSAMRSYEDDSRDEVFTPRRVQSVHFKYFGVDLLSALRFIYEFWYRSPLRLILHVCRAFNTCKIFNPSCCSYWFTNCDYYTDICLSVFSFRLVCPSYEFNYTVVGLYWLLAVFFVLRLYLLTNFMLSEWFFSWACRL